MNITDANYHDVVRRLVDDNRKVSKGTNLQNIPSRGDGIRVRATFRPPENMIFAGSDLGQIEPRIMSHIMYTEYGDNSMRSIFVDEVDLYTTMAQMTFNLAEEYCIDKAYDPTHTFQPRKLMKTGVLAVSYRQSVRSFSQKMGVSQEVAEFFFENFDKTFPSFNKMVEDILDRMKRKGFSETLFGRKRRFPDFNKVAAEVRKNERKLQDLYYERKRLMKKGTADAAARLLTVQEKIDDLAEKKGLVGYWSRAAFNSVIQGTGADILKLNGARLAETCRSRGWEFPASIHDEVKAAIPKPDLTPESIELINTIMTKTVSLSVPLISDTVIEPRWMEEYSPSEWDYDNCRPMRDAIEKYRRLGVTPELYGYAA